MREQRFGYLCSIGILLLSISSAMGQQQAGPTNVKEKNAENRVRVVEVKFKEDSALSGLAASPVLSYPMQCSEDGTPFVEMFDPPDFNKKEVYSIAPNGSHAFNINLVDDLGDKIIHDYYAARSEVIFLLSATEENGIAGLNSLTSASPGKHEEQQKVEHTVRYYVAKFDNKGEYKSHVQLDASFTPRKIAEFESGTFLSYGVDNIRRKLALALLNSDGSVLHYLELPSDYGRWYKSYSESAIRSRSESKPAILPVSQMMPYLNRILVVQKNSMLPILGIREDGDIQEFKIVGRGTLAVIDSVIPSENYWFVRFRDEAEHGTRVTSQPPEFFEVDPQTGMRVAKLKLEGIRTDEVACYRSGELIGFRRDDQGKFVAMVGEVQ